MSFNLQQLRELVERDYTVQIEAHYADRGMQALRVLGPALDEIHEQLAYELLPDGLTVVVSLEPDEQVLQVANSMAVSAAQLPGLVRGSATIEVLHDGSFRLLPEETDPFSFADRGLVYYFNGRDNFIVGEEQVVVDNPTAFPSIWGTPTFFDLGMALMHYRDRIALHCRCPYLEKLWHDPSRRWLLKNKPEDTMQSSLYQFLVSTLRGHKRIEIRREQPVGGAKPPDIKVSWTLTNRIAFVEVKWMGASVHAAEPRVSWRPSEVEANNGAAQLIGYLNDNRSEGGGFQTMGFLVVFDGRRKGVDFGVEELSSEDALYFLSREVIFSPDYARERHDFAPPLRLFMYPLKPEN